MFTGLVEETGRVISLAPNAEAWELAIAAQAVLADLALGDSIAVNGCCLTAARFDATSVRFDVLEETRRLTNFSALRPVSELWIARQLFALGARVAGVNIVIED